MEKLTVGEAAQVWDRSRGASLSLHVVVTHVISLTRSTRIVRLVIRSVRHFESATRERDALSGDRAERGCSRTIHLRSVNALSDRLAFAINHGFAVILRPELDDAPVGTKISIPRTPVRSVLQNAAVSIDGVAVASVSEVSSDARRAVFLDTRRNPRGNTRRIFAIRVDVVIACSSEG